MGSGPFKVTKVLDKDNWTYEANPIYWKKDPDGRTLPYVDGMEYHVIQDPTASQAAWEAEQIWVVLWQSSAQMGPGQLKEMVERGNGKFVAYPVPCCPNGILLNTSKPPFDNPWFEEPSCSEWTDKISTRLAGLGRASLGQRQGPRDIRLPCPPKK